MSSARTSPARSGVEKRLGVDDPEVARLIRDYRSVPEISREDEAANAEGRPALVEVMSKVEKQVSQ